jgi:hypothetical protein
VIFECQIANLPAIGCTNSRTGLLAGIANQMQSIESEIFFAANNHRLSIVLQSIGCRGMSGRNTSGGEHMLWTIFVILLILWFLGLVSSYTLGGYIHLLLLIALVVLILQLISGRRPIV